MLLARQFFQSTVRADKIGVVRMGPTPSRVQWSAVLLLLAAACCGGGSGVVIGTEYEPEKARAAREHFEQSGLSNFIDLREGDLRDTLRSIDGPVDFMLVDIWIPMSRPALELVAPHLRPGAIVICDNTEQHRAAYADYFAFINDPTQRFRTMTLPFGGGLEMSVRAI